MIGGEELIDFFKKVVPIGVHREKWIIEVALKNAIGTVHHTIRNSIDHIISATDVVGCSRTGLETFSIKTGDEQISFTGPDWIGHR